MHFSKLVPQRQRCVEGAPDTMAERGVPRVDLQEALKSLVWTETILVVM